MDLNTGIIFRWSVINQELDNLIFYDAYDSAYRPDMSIQLFSTKVNSLFTIYCYSKILDTLYILSGTAFHEFHLNTSSGNCSQLIFHYLFYFL
jgi:hypothetical protein